MVASTSNGFPNRFVSAVAVTLLAELSTGCTARAAREPAAVPEKQRAYIAEPCAALKEQQPGAVPVGILLEVADVVEPIGVPIKGWLATHSVEVHHLARISVPVTASTPVSGPFGTCLDRTCSQAEDATVQVTVIKIPTDASAPVELELDFTSGNGRPRRLSVEAADQEPVFKSLATPPEQAVVITPYYLFEPRQRSLELLAQCASSRVSKATASR